MTIRGQYGASQCTHCIGFRSPNLGLCGHNPQGCVSKVVQRFTWIATSGEWNPTSGSSWFLSPWNLFLSALQRFQILPGMESKIWGLLLKLGSRWFCPQEPPCQPRSCNIPIMERLAMQLHTAIPHLEAQPTCHNNQSKCSPPQPPWQLGSWGVFWGWEGIHSCRSRSHSRSRIHIGPAWAPSPRSCSTWCRCKAWHVRPRIHKERSHKGQEWLGRRPGE